MSGCIITHFLADRRQRLIWSAVDAVPEESEKTGTIYVSFDVERARYHLLSMIIKLKNRSE